MMLLMADVMMIITIEDEDEDEIKKVELYNTHIIYKET